MNRMKKYFVLLISAILFSCCYFEKENVELTGQTEQKTLSIGSFSRLDVQNGVEIIICDTISEPYAETDIALSDYLQVVQTGKKLVIGYKRNLCWMGDGVSRVWLPSDKAELHNIHISGASSVHLSEPITSKNVEMHLSGASTLYATLHSNAVEAHISGSSHAFLSGEAETMKAYISGASALHSEMQNSQYTFDVTRFSGHLSGSSVAYIHCDGLIEAELSGASILFYSGNADITHCICTDVSCVMHEQTDIN